MMSEKFILKFRLQLNKIALTLYKKEIKFLSE